MLDWFDVNIAYWHWIVIGLILAAFEIFIPSFVILWFGLSAIAVGLLLWVLPLSFTLQLLIWIALSLLNVWLWFKWVSPRLKNKTFSGMAYEAMLGQVGMVIEWNAASSRGRLRFPAPIVGNDEWLFICEDAVDVGDRVRVKEFSGNTLIVSKC
jgi:hypothetical protein